MPQGEPLRSKKPVVVVVVVAALGSPAPSSNVYACLCLHAAFVCVPARQPHQFLDSGTKPLHGVQSPVLKPYFVSQCHRVFL